MTQLSLYKEEKAVALRRAVSESQLEGLNKIDKSVFLAGTKKQIQEYSDEELTRTLAQLFKFVAMDIGYNITEKDVWAYNMTRIMGLLKTYYPRMSLSDVKLAFELMVVGELDPYMKEGDKKHYQQFNADFVTRVINAYRQKQNDVNSRVLVALVPKAKELCQHDKESLRMARKQRNMAIILEYKYRGVIKMSEIDEILLYDELLRNGFAEEVTVTMQDKQKALSMYLSKAEKGLVNQYTANSVRRKGEDATEIQSIAAEFGRRREIFKALDRMLSEN